MESGSDLSATKSKDLSTPDEELSTPVEVMKVLLLADMVGIDPGDEAVAQPELNKLTETVVGLEYVAEYMDPLGEYESGYLCTLCEARFTSTSILKHVVNSKHRLKYLDVNYNAQYTVLSFKALSAERRYELLNKYTKEIEEKEGRGRIALRIILPGEARSSVFAVHKKLPRHEKDKSSSKRKRHSRSRSGSRSRKRRSRSHSRGHNSRKRSRSRSRSRGYSRRHRDNTRTPDEKDTNKERERESAWPTTISPSSSFQRVEERSQSETFLPLPTPPQPPASFDQLPAPAIVAPFPNFLMHPPPSVFTPQIPPPVLNFAPLQQPPPQPFQQMLPPPPFGLQQNLMPQQHMGSDRLAEFRLMNTAERPAYDSPADFRDLLTQHQATHFVRAQSPTVPDMQKPTFVYSEKQEKALRIAEIEKYLPPNCERNVEHGWFSVRLMQPEYYRRLISPETESMIVITDHEYFQYRNLTARTNYYSDWNPFLMRRLQDKFNFKLSHITWLQKLIVDHNVPSDRPLTVSDLTVLQDEVEGAVLNDLVGNILQPRWSLVKPDPVVQEYDPLSAGRKLETKLSPEIIEYDRHKLLVEYPHLPEGANLPETLIGGIIVQSGGSCLSVGSSGSGGAIVTTVNQLSLSQFYKPEVASVVSATAPAPAVLHNASTTATPVHATAPTDLSNSSASTEVAPKDAILMGLIDQILETAKNTEVKNAVLQLLLNFPNAKQVLFRLATQQPATLQQLISVIKNPNLSIPAELLKQLEIKLKTFAQQVADNNALRDPALENSSDALESAQTVSDDYDPTRPLDDRYQEVGKDKPSKSSKNGNQESSNSKQAEKDKEKESEDPEKKKKKMLEIMERVEQFRLKMKQKDQAATPSVPEVEAPASYTSSVPPPLVNTAAMVPQMPMFQQPPLTYVPTFIPPPQPVDYMMQQMMPPFGGGIQMMGPPQMGLPQFMPSHPSISFIPPPVNSPEKKSSSSVKFNSANLKRLA